MNSNEFGRLVETKIKARLMEKGHKVLVPENGPYDLALDNDGKLVRIECKHGVYKNGIILVNGRCNGRTKARGNYTSTYHGKADLIAVWNVETDRYFLVPVEEIGKSGQLFLRVHPPKKKNKLINLAEDYEI